MRDPPAQILTYFSAYLTLEKVEPRYLPTKVLYSLGVYSKAIDGESYECVSQCFITTFFFFKAQFL